MIYALEIIIIVLIIELVGVLFVSIYLFISVSKNEFDEDTAELYNIGKELYDNYIGDICNIKKTGTYITCGTYLDINRSNILIGHPYNAYIIHNYINQFYIKNKDDDDIGKTLYNLIFNYSSDETVQELIKDITWNEPVLSYKKYDSNKYSKAAQIYLSSIKH